MDGFTPAYIDRRSGLLKQDAICAPRFLGWSYNTSLGWALTRLLISRRSVSRIYGWINRLPSSRRKIEPFVRRMGLDVREISRPLEQFRNFSEFITRDIDLRSRPIAPGPQVCVAPADGRYLAYPSITAERRFVIKAATFDLRSMLRDDSLAEDLDAGAMVVARLYLADYHHFHFPFAAVPRPAVPVGARYFAVTPYARRRVVPFYKENFRMITVLDCDLFGPVAMVEIGAFSIGSVRQCYQPGVPVDKGDHKGVFELGASVVVLIFRRGTIRLDQDLTANTEAGYETYVRLGESIGRAAA